MNAIWKEVAIQDLPDGYFKEQLTKYVSDTSATVIVVAKPGGANDWAGYIGWPSSKFLHRDYIQNETIWFYTNNVFTIEQVMENGDKLDCKTACAIFPVMNPDAYRR